MKNSIIPKPYITKFHDGNFQINSNSKIQILHPAVELQNIVKGLIDTIYQFSGIRISITDNSQIMNSNVIIISLSEPSLNAEGYKLEISAERIIIEAKTINGIFYAYQTIFQLFPNGTSSKEICNLPCCKIIDQPRFNWRGMHLDVSRHFFDINFIKKYIDYLAMFKYNIFHWHLTDDNGWRLEIKKYPKLTEIGAWRAPREGIDWRDCEPQKPGEETTYGGYYTQDEVKEIIQYAQERFITIVPEIEMPGHTSEVLAAYPELGCTGGPYKVATGTYWPNKDIFCAGNDKIFTFLENVLDEVIDLFPSEYIHIGGDEANKEEWKTCGKCRKRMQEENLQNVEELQSWFIKRIAKYLQSKGKKMIGWDEILEGGLADNAIVMSWRGEVGGIKAAIAGHDVIMCPGTHCYFDHYQGDPETEPKAIGGFTDLKKVYSYEPIPAELSAKQEHHVLGAQGNVWTEWMETPEHVEYMIFPRMTALSEVLWSSKETRNWDDFQNRMKRFVDIYNMICVNYRQLD